MIDDALEMGDGRSAFNPYVGPRPFERKHRNFFFGRRREGRRLRNLVLSHSVVLFYAQSGCGKTSLINACLLPAMEEEGFCVLPVARVWRALPPGFDFAKVDNIYAFNILHFWATVGTSKNLDSSRLRHGLPKPPSKPSDDDETPYLIVLDQFEELFTSYPGCWDKREDLFTQLDKILQTFPTTRIVLSIREDYLAHLDPYSNCLARGNWSHLRLEALKQGPAVEAITKPLKDTKWRYAPGVAEHLVKDLAAVQTIDERGQTKTITGQFVEPVQLQVVCQNLWESICAEPIEIGEQHLAAFGDVDHALRSFYETAISRASIDTELERSLRDWVESQLITSADTRGMVMKGESDTSEIPEEALAVLLDTHLIRGEWRHGARWLELTHDRFIRPIQKSNQIFRERSQQQRAEIAEAKVETAELKAENVERLSGANYYLFGACIINASLAGLMHVVNFAQWLPGWITAVMAGIAALMMGVFAGLCWPRVFAWIRHVSIGLTAVQILAAAFCLACIGTLWLSPHRWSIAVAIVGMAIFFFDKNKMHSPVNDYRETVEHEVDTQSGAV